MNKQVEVFKLRLEAQWELCQWGLVRCAEYVEDYDKIIEWLGESSDWCDIAWIEILGGMEPDLYSYITMTPDFPHGNGYWRQMVSSSPFALLKSKENQV